MSHKTQDWSEAIMIPIFKKGKDKSKASRYTPITLTSCNGKLMERMTNTRLLWYIESKNVLTPEYAEVRRNHSAEDQIPYKVE